MSSKRGGGGVSRQTNGKHEGGVETTLLYGRCGACGVPCGSGEKYCAICGNDVSRSRAKAAAQIAAVSKSLEKMSRSDVECIYFQFIFGHFRRPDMSVMSPDNVPGVLASMHLDPENDTVVDEKKFAITNTEREALRATKTSLLFQDYCQAMEHLVDAASSVEKFRYLFQIYDGDVDGKLARSELYQLLVENVDPALLSAKTARPFADALHIAGGGERDAVEARRRSIEASRTRLYTWLKKNFGPANRLCGPQDALTLLSTRFFLDGDYLIDKIGINIEAVARFVDALNMGEYREEAKRVYGKRAVDCGAAFLSSVADA